jgi:hypothetical protein
MYQRIQLLEQLVLSIADTHGDDDKINTHRKALGQYKETQRKDVEESGKAVLFFLAVLLCTFIIAFITDKCRLNQTHGIIAIIATLLLSALWLCCCWRK